jgi:hypothetical protein
LHTRPARWCGVERLLPSLLRCYCCHRNPGIFSSELGVVVSDDRVGDPKAESNVLDKAYHLLGVDFGQGASLNPFSELINHDKQVGEAPRVLS